MSRQAHGNADGRSPPPPPPPPPSEPQDPPLLPLPPPPESLACSSPPLAARSSGPPRLRTLPADDWWLPNAAAARLTGAPLTAWRSLRSTLAAHACSTGPPQHARAIDSGLTPVHPARRASGLLAIMPTHLCPLQCVPAAVTFSAWKNAPQDGMVRARQAFIPSQAGQGVRRAP